MILKQARERLMEAIDNLGIQDREITITCRTLTPEEAIGNPLHDDYPIQLGKERMIEACFMGRKGQAFSDSCSNFTGKVSDILALDLDTNARRAIFISSLNAIMAHLGRIPECIHCRDDDLMRCADHFHDSLKNRLIKADRVLLVGLQPRFLEKLATIKTVRVCDLNPDVIGTCRCGVVIDGPDRFPENAAWAGEIFATGSTIVNGTIDEILKAGRDTCFYGVTVTGVASLMGLNQFCHVIEQAGSVPV